MNKLFYVNPCSLLQLAVLNRFVGLITISGIQWRFYVGARGHRPPPRQILPRPPNF